MLSKKSSKWALEARIAQYIATAEIIENQDFDECLVIPTSRALRVTGPCPLNCGNGYRKSATKNCPEHSEKARLGLVMKLLEALEAGDKQTAEKLVMLRDEAGKKYEVSHLCRTGPGKICIQSSHFVIENRVVNVRRMPHQNGNSVCNCADFGDRPGMVNPNVGVKVFNDQGDHVGWAPARGTKRRKVTNGRKA